MTEYDIRRTVSGGLPVPDAPPPQQPRTEAGRRLLSALNEAVNWAGAESEILAIEEEAVEPPLPVDPDGMIALPFVAGQAGPVTASPASSVPLPVDPVREAALRCRDLLEIALAAPTPTAPPALDVERLAEALLSTLPMSEDYHSLGTWRRAAVEIAAEYARLSGTDEEPER